MAKYEIMLIISGSLDEKAADAAADEISSTINKYNPEIQKYGLKELAYKIKKDTHGYYYQYNFECELSSDINEFGRLARINKNSLRHLIINLEKDYGYRATVNPKKIKSNQIKAEIHARRKAEHEKLKEARMKEYLEKTDENLNVLENQQVSESTSNKENKVKKETTRTKKVVKEDTTIVSDSSSDSETKTTKAKSTRASAVKKDDVKKTTTKKTTSSTTTKKTTTKKDTTKTVKE